MNLDHIDPGNAGGSVLIPDRPIIAAVAPTYPCTDCDRIFSNLEGLRQHRLENHRVTRPFLYLQQRPQHLDHYVITRPLSSEDIKFIDAEGVTIDEGDLLIPEDAANKISSREHGRAFIKLTNRGVSSSYVLEFRLLSDADAERVETRFLEAMDNPAPLASRLVAFNASLAGVSSGALCYASALERYLVGVMAKDRIAGCHIPFDQFAEQLGEAQAQLAPIERPLSRIVASIARLIISDLDVSSNASVPVIDQTVKTLKTGEFQELDDSLNSNRALPVDQVTEELVAFATRDDNWRTQHEKSLQVLAASKLLPQSDRVKINLLLLAWHGKQGDTKRMNTCYSKLRYVLDTVHYADTIMERYR